MDFFEFKDLGDKEYLASNPNDRGRYQFGCCCNGHQYTWDESGCDTNNPKKKWFWQIGI